MSQTTSKWAYTKGLHDLGNGCYAYLQPDGSWGWSNAGLVADSGESLLVDTLFDLKLTREMLDTMRRAEPKAATKIRTLVNTHSNGDQFADAYKDRNPTMQFVKLWSCAECFFAIEKDGVTELNAQGIAAVLTFGGYRIVEPRNYGSFKKRLKKMYKLRSKAVHRAKFGHIEFADLNDFSRWTAWLIFSMVALSEKGYKTLRQVRERTVRLDRLSTASTASRS